MGRRSTAREDMLNSAIALVRAKGVEAVGLTDVVTHAQAPRGSIYHHFPGGKTQLVEESTRRAGALMGSRISAALVELGPAGALMGIVEFFRQQLRASDFNDGCPIAPTALEGAAYPGARAAAAESFQSWTDSIATALWQAGLPRERARSVSTMALASIEGALILAKAQRSTEPLDQIADELTRLLDSLT